MPPAALNEWHHVLMTYDGAVFDFFLDGTRSGDSGLDSGNVVPNDMPLSIGGISLFDNRVENFVGQIDEVLIIGEATDSCLHAICLLSAQKCTSAHGP